MKFFLDTFNGDSDDELDDDLLDEDDAEFDDGDVDDLLDDDDDDMEYDDEWCHTCGYDYNANGDCGCKA